MMGLGVVNRADLSPQGYYGGVGSFGEGGFDVLPFPSGRRVDDRPGDPFAQNHLDIRHGIGQLDHVGAFIS